MAQLNDIDSINLLPTEAAFAALLPEIQAVPDDDLVAVNVDVVGAVTLVLGVLPELRALRPQLADELPRFDLARFDKLEQYALAVNHAHTLHRSKESSKVDVAQLAAEVAVLRDRLLADAVSLANYQLVDGERLKECKRSTSYQAAATDVFTIIAVFKETWPKLEGRTPVTLVALSEAGNKALELLAAVGVRDQAPVTTGEAARLRQKAFTLFSKAYDEVRRAVAYLRAPFGDAEDVTPSFFAGRGGRLPTRANDAKATNAPASTPPPTSDDAPDSGTLPIDNSAGLPVTQPIVK